MSSSPPTEPTLRSPARWRSPAGWSLRARLVAIMIALLVLLGLIVGATAEIYLHRSLYEQLDNRLADMNARVQHGPVGFRPDAARFGPPPGAQVDEIVLRLSTGAPPDGGIVTLSTGTDGSYTN